MGKLGKVLGISVGAMALLLVGAVLIVPMVVDPNDYKGLIIERVKELTGQDLTIDGDISLSLFPWLGVDIGRISLSNAENFGTQSFANSERIQVRAKVIPLLRGEAQMDTIVIEGLSLNLSRDAQGRTNFDHLLDAPPSDTTQSGAPMAALAIGGVKLTESTIDWNDALNGSRSTVGNISLDTGPLSIDEPVEFNLSFELKSSQPSLSGRVALSAAIGFDAAAQVVSASELSLKASVQSPKLADRPIPFDVSGNALVDLKGQTVTLGDFSFSVPDWELSPGVQAKLIATGTIEGDIGNRRYRSKSLRVEGGIEGEGVPGGQQPFKLTTDFDLNLADESLVMQAFALDNAMAGLSGSASVIQLLSAPQAKGELNLAPLNVRVVLAQLGQSVPETTDENVLTSLALHTAFQANAKEVALKSLNAKLDDTVLTGNVAITDITTGALHIELNADRLNADRYLARNTPEASPGAGAAAAGSLPTEALRSLEIDGKLTIGELKVNRLDVEDVAVSVQAKAGLIELSPLRAGLYDGTYQSNLIVDARGEQTRVGLDEKLTGVRLGPLLDTLSVDIAQMDLSDAVGDLAIKADITGDPGQQQFRFTDASVTAHVTGSAIPGGKLLAAAKAKLMLDLSKQLVSAQSVSFAVNNLRMPSGLRATGVLGANAVTAQLETDSYAVSGLNIDLKALQLNPASSSTPLKLRVETLNTDLTERTLTAEDIDVSLLGLKANGNVTIDNLLDDPQLAGVLETASLNPKQLLPVFGIPAPVTTDPDALTLLVVQTTFKGSPNSLKLSPLSLQLDTTEISGEVEVSDLGALKGVRFDLAATRLNADRYLPPQTSGQAATPGAAATAIPLELIRHLDVEGHLKIDHLIFSNLALTDIKLTVTGKDGVVTMDPLGALLYGGRYTGNVSLDGQGKAAKLDINESLENIHIGPLLRDATQQKEKLTGRVGLRIQASATGVDTDQMLRTLTGQTALLLQDGSIKGIDIVNTICNLVSGGAGGETRFSEMKASGQIRNGVVDSRDLNVKSPLLRASGGGIIDLVRAQIDYLAKVSLVGTCQGQGGLALQDLSSIHIPVAVTGALEHPKFKPDFGAVLAQGLQKGLGEKLEDKLGIKGLGGLLGGGTQSQTQDNDTLDGQAPPKAKEDPLQKLGKDLLKGLFQ